MEPDAFTLRLSICCSLNLQQSDILDIQRAETVKDKTSITQRQRNVKVTAGVSQKRLTGSGSASRTLRPKLIIKGEKRNSSICLKTSRSMRLLPVMLSGSVSSFFFIFLNSFII